MNRAQAILRSLARLLKNSSPLRWPWRNPLFAGTAFVLVVYIIGGVWYGFSLYKAKRTEGPVVWMARIYPLPIARVSQSFIFPSGFFTLVASGQKYRQVDQNAVPDDATLRTQILSTLVNEKIMFNEARARDVLVSPEEAREFYSQLAEDNGGKDAFAEVLRKLYGLTEEQFILLRVRAAVQQKKLEESAFTRLKVRVIVHTNEGHLKSLIGELNAGKDFGELARANSQDQKTRENGGDLGFIDHLTIAQSYGDEVEGVLFAGKSGDVVGPVKTKDGSFVLFRIEEVSGSINARFENWLTEEQAKKRIWRLY